MKSTKIALLASACLFSFQLFAQDATVKVKEFGIGFSNLNSFGFQYKFGTNKSMYRINLFVLSSSANSSTGTSVNHTDTTQTNDFNQRKTPIDINFSIGMSKLKIRTINDKLDFFSGPSLNFRMSYYKTNSTNHYTNLTTSTTTESTDVTFEPSLGCVLGLRYKFNQSILLSAEITPNIYYSYVKSDYKSTDNNHPTNYRTYSDKTTNIGIGGLQTSFAFLSLVYRMTK